MAVFRSLLLLLLVTSCAAAEEPRWPDERSAGPFQVHADFSLADSETLLGELAALQRDLETTLGLKVGREPIHLFLFQEKATYQAYLQRYFPKVPNRRALFIKGRGPGMVFAHRGEDFEIDVRHESTHALLHTAVVNPPLWLDEGLAEYFEMPRSQRSTGSPHAKTIRSLAEVGALPRLDELEKIHDLHDLGREEYRDAWAWIRFCLHGPPEAADELRRYLQESAAKADPGPFGRRLRGRVPDLDRQALRQFQTLR